MEGGAFNCCKKLVLGGVDEVTAQRNAAQIRVDQHGAVAVVPGKAQESGLAWEVALKTLGQALYISPGTASDGFEDVSGGGETCLNSSEIGVYATGNDAAHTRNQLSLLRDGDDAGGSPYDVDDVAYAATGADGVPVGVEGSDGNGDSRIQIHPGCPEGAKLTGNLA